MNNKLILRGTGIEWQKMLPELLIFAAVNLYFIFILHRILLLLLLLPIYVMIRRYNSPKCIITKNTAVLCRGRQTGKHLEKITSVGILSMAGDRSYIFLCGVDKQKIEKFENTGKKAKNTSFNAVQRSWEEALLFFLSHRAQQSMQVILLPYSHRSFAKLTSFFGVEIAEESIASTLNIPVEEGAVLDILANTTGTAGSSHSAE